MPIESPTFPIGPFSPIATTTDEDRRQWIRSIAQLPSQLRDAVDGLNDEELDTQYRNWSIRQIAHHVADSHVNSYVRFKWALTEETPMIKAYHEGLWSELPESVSGSIMPSLDLLNGLHARWVQLLESLSAAEYERSFLHPETNETVSLNSALEYYAWHGRHHTGQILWLRESLNR